jgi:hypothetical protein
MLYRFACRRVIFGILVKLWQLPFVMIVTDCVLVRPLCSVALYHPALVRRSSTCLHRIVLCCSCSVAPVTVGGHPPPDRRGLRDSSTGGAAAVPGALHRPAGARQREPRRACGGAPHDRALPRTLVWRWRHRRRGFAAATGLALLCSVLSGLSQRAQ